MEEMPKDPLDVLWDQIQIAYAAIIRAQSIMYVKDRKDKTIEKVEEKRRKCYRRALGGPAGLGQAKQLSSGAGQGPEVSGGTCQAI